MEKVINQAMASPATFGKLLENLQKYNDHMLNFLQTITRQDFPLTEEHLSMILGIQFNDATMERAIIFYRKLMSKDSAHFLVLLLNSTFRLLSSKVACQTFYGRIFQYIATNYNNFAHLMKKALRTHFLHLYQYTMSLRAEELENCHLHFRFLFQLALTFNGFEVEVLDEAIKLLLEIDLQQSKNLDTEQTFNNQSELSEDAICGSLKVMSLEHMEIQPDTARMEPFEMNQLIEDSNEDVDIIIMVVDQLLTEIIVYLQQTPDTFCTGSFFPIFFDKMMPVLPLEGSTLAPFLIFPFLSNENYMTTIVSTLVKVAFAAPNTGIGAAVSACCYLCGILLHFNFKDYGVFYQVVNVLASIAEELSAGMPMQEQFALLRPEHQRAVIAAQTFMEVLNKVWQVMSLSSFEQPITHMLENNLFAYLGQNTRRFWDLIVDVQCYLDDIEQAIMIEAGRCIEQEIVVDVFRNPEFNQFSSHINGIWRSW